MLIETKRLVLRSVEPEDAEFLAKLMEEIQFDGCSCPHTFVAPVSTEIEERWISTIGSRNDEASMIIERRSGKEPIGIISASQIEKRNASAHLGLRLKDVAWNHGFGSEAMSAAVKFMFEKLNIHRVWLIVDEENARAIRCYEKAGFTFEGVLREDHVRGGRWRNSIVMSIIRSESKKGGRR